MPTWAADPGAAALPPSPPPPGFTVVKIVLLLFISIVGYVQGTWSNAEPFIDPDFGV